MVGDYIIDMTLLLTLLLPSPMMLAFNPVAMHLCIALVLLCAVVMEPSQGFRIPTGGYFTRLVELVWKIGWGLLYFVM